MGAFEYRQAEEIRDAFSRHGVRYLFIGKSGAILLGFPDTTQDADLYAEKTPENCSALVKALADLGFPLTATESEEILRGKDFIQLKNGPFDLDLVFAPTESNGSRMRGAGTWMSKDFPSVIPTTSLTAIANRFPASSPFETIGTRAVDRPLLAQSPPAPSRRASDATAAACSP